MRMCTFCRLMNIFEKGLRGGITEETKPKISQDEMRELQEKLRLN